MMTDKRVTKEWLCQDIWKKRDNFSVLNTE